MLIAVFGLGVAFPSTGQAGLSAETGQDPARSSADHPAHHPSVKLSWVASLPASKLARDAIVGYNVYRSTKSHDRNPQRMNSKLCPGTTYTDTDVEAGTTYFYVTRGVSANLQESGPSNEIKVKIPPHD